MFNYFKAHILEMVTIMTVPFLMLFVTRGFPIFKKKPHFLYAAMVIPTIITAYLLLGRK
jgi:hypothetical protein